MVALTVTTNYSANRTAENGSAASAAVLAVADRLFYSSGIGVVSMREIAKAAGISLGRLSKLYPTKEALAVAYISDRHAADVQLLVQLRSSELDPQQILEAALNGIISDLLSNDFRGCPFLNASAEAGSKYPAVAHQVREHRDWYAREATELLRAAGHPHPADAADDLLLARDGGMSSIHGGNVIAAVAAMRRAIARAFAEIDSAEIV